MRSWIIWICLQLIYLLSEEGTIGQYVTFNEHWSTNGPWEWACLSDKLE